MADKTLTDVTASLKNVETAVKAVGETISNPPKSSADVEAADEKARSDAANRGIFKGIYDTLQKGFGAATTKDKKKGGLIAGLLGGVGAGLGGIGKAVGNIGMGFAKGMIGLGAGIGGFAIALGGSAMILGMMGTDGSALTTIITNFFDAFTPENAAKMGVIVVMAGLLAGFKVKGHEMALMMTGIGAGIAGFAGGILLGSALAGYGLTLMGGLDGGALAKLLNSFFGAMTAETAAGVGVLVTLAATAGKLDVGGIRMATIMTGIGAGIAGFAGGILIGSAISKYGLAALGGLDTTSLTSLLDGFFSSITPAIAAGMGIIVTLAGIAAKLDIGPLEMAGGMTAIGAGIAGFSVGILLADGAAKLGEMASLDGSSLKTLISNFMGAFDGIGFLALGALITAGAVLGAALGPGALIAVPLGMGAIGAGIAAFMVPLLAADWIAGLGGDNAGGNLATLLTNIGKGIGGFLGGFAGETMKQMENIDGDKLAQIGRGIFDLGTGMLAFAGGRAAGGLADIGSAIGNFFGGDDKGPLHVFAQISKDKSIDAKRLTELGSGIGDMAIGLSAFAAINSTGLAANALSTGLIANYSMNKSLNLIKKSQENALAGMGGGGGDIYNNFSSTDNSVKQSQVSAISMPESARHNIQKEYGGG